MGVRLRLCLCHVGDLAGLGELGRLAARWFCWDWRVAPGSVGGSLGLERIEGAGSRRGVVVKPGELGRHGTKVTLLRARCREDWQMSVTGVAR